MSPTATRRPEPDQACVDAVPLARAAAEELAGPGQVGEHLTTVAEGDRVVTHLFGCLNPAYIGWNWAVTVNRASRAKLVTVSEVVLLPGTGALLAPAWVPWTERVRPGDLKVGDLMPASSDDERLTPVLAIEGDDGLIDWADGESWAEAARAAAETEGALYEGAPSAVEAPVKQDVTPRFGGPSRVLSAIGRDDAAERWYGGDSGPYAAVASAAPGRCQTCGFLVPLSGPLGRVFGVCANEFAPDDGKVVSADHGCGAHSDAGVVADSPHGAPVPTIDELGYDLMTGPVAELPEGALESIDHELG